MNRRLRHLVRSLTCRRRPRADFGKLLSCSARVRGCLGNALRNADPRQFFGAPDMQVRRDPGWVIERAGLDERDPAVCRAVAVEVGAAVATEESIERLAARAAMILVATRTAAPDLQAVLGHGDVHRECGARVLAAGLAVADHLHQRLSVRAVAHGTTEATSLDRRHRISSLLVLLSATSLARNSGRVMRTDGPRSSASSVSSNTKVPEITDRGLGHATAVSVSYCAIPDLVAVKSHPPSSAAPAGGFPTATARSSGCGSVRRWSARTAARRAR